MANLLAILTSVSVRVANLTLSVAAVTTDEAYALRRGALPGPRLGCFYSILCASSLPLIRVVYDAIAQRTTLAPAILNKLGLALGDGEQEVGVENEALTRGAGNKRPEGTNHSQLLNIPYPALAQRPTPKEEVEVHLVGGSLYLVSVFLSEGDPLWLGSLGKEVY